MTEDLTEKVSTDHSPLPWQVLEGGLCGRRIVAKGGEYVASSGGSLITKDNADFAIKAVNNHDALVEALEGLMEDLKTALVFDGGLSPEDAEKFPSMIKARSLIAKLKGE